VHFERASDNCVSYVVQFHSSLPFLCVLCGKGH
jgi:hypothetical protein